MIPHGQRKAVVMRPNRKASGWKAAELSSNILYLGCVHQAETQVAVQLVVKIETQKRRKTDFPALST